MKYIETIEELEALYDQPAERSLNKVNSVISPLYKEWIDASRFVVMATVGEEGTDASPRGDDGSVVEIVDPKTVLMPDWRGNNRLDSLRNIVRDGRIALMFMINGEDIVVRVNGRAKLTNDEAICQPFEQSGKHPKTVIVIEVEEVYFQCAKAIYRSGLWTQAPVDVPTGGALLKDRIPDTDVEDFDKNYPEYAKKIMWG